MLSTTDAHPLSFHSSSKCRDSLAPLANIVLWKNLAFLFSRLYGVFIWEFGNLRMVESDAQVIVSDFRLFSVDCLFADVFFLT